jgi:putative transposase
MNQVFVRGVNLVIPITKKVSKNVYKKTKNRGCRLSIVGLFEPLSSFVYGLVIGGVDRKAYIQMMEKEALLSC